MSRPEASSAAKLSHLTARERATLAGILARLGSPFEGERAAAGLVASAFLKRHNLAWADLTAMADPAPQPSPQSSHKPASSPAKSPPPAADPVPRPTDRRVGRGGRWIGYCRRRAVAIGAALNCFS